MKTATPQDTFDHMIGSGALSYEWWHAVDSMALRPMATMP